MIEPTDNNGNSKFRRRLLKYAGSMIFWIHNNSRKKTITHVFDNIQRYSIDAKSTLVILLAAMVIGATTLQKEILMNNATIKFLTRFVM